jgi:hypothetical protein
MGLIGATISTGGHSEEHLRCAITAWNIWPHAQPKWAISSSRLDSDMRSQAAFCAVDQPQVAVCVQPGTELAFVREIESQAAFRLFSTQARNQGGAVSARKRGTALQAS